MSGHSGRCFRSQRRAARRHRLQRERFERWRKEMTRGNVGTPRMFSTPIGRWMVPKSAIDMGERFKQMLAENFR